MISLCWRGIGVFLGEKEKYRRIKLWGARGVLVASGNR